MFGLACSYSAGIMKIASIGIAILATCSVGAVPPCRLPPCPGPAPPAPAPAPVDNTPLVFPFEALSFTSGGASPGVFDKLQETSQNNGGLPDAATTQENVFGFENGAITTAANNAINTVFANFQNNVGAGLPNAGTTQENLFGDGATTAINSGLTNFQNNIP
jgi:hypothetical protein